MAASSDDGVFQPDGWLLDRVPTLTEVWEAPTPSGSPLEDDARAQMDAVIDAAVESALRRWRAQIEPMLRQQLADAVAQAVRQALDGQAAAPPPVPFDTTVERSGLPAGLAASDPFSRGDRSSAPPQHLDGGRETPA